MSERDNLIRTQKPDQDVISGFVAKLSFALRRDGGARAQGIQDLTRLAPEQVPMCFPQLQPVLELAGRMAAANDEQQRRDADNRIRVEEDDNPIATRLAAAYQRYGYVRECPMSEVEIARARLAMKSIEDKLKATDPTLDAEALWREAVSLPPPHRDRGFCEKAFDSLLSMFREIAPNEALRKDF